MLRLGLLFKPELFHETQIYDILTKIEASNIATFHILGKNQCITNLINTIDLHTFGIDGDSSFVINWDTDDNTNKTPVEIPKAYLKFCNPSEHLDYIICFGGDGTMLRSIYCSAIFNAPVLGVNFGKLGFLTDITINELENSIHMLDSGNYSLEKRMMLEVNVVRENKTILSEIALNDVVMHKGHESRLIDINLYSSGNLIYEMRSDGVIISTPTGSTAYSLSAGGPIISPELEALIVTPLNPHILSIRPMVFSSGDIIEILVPENQTSYLQMDGVAKTEILTDDRVIIKKSNNLINFVKVSYSNFYEVLRNKLNMGKNNVKRT
jgi:NAD+ kinase